MPILNAGSFDRSGMWLKALENEFVVAHVSAGGPAQTAGVAVGDRIITLDGRAVRAHELSGARMRLRTRADGTRITLDLRRGSDDGRGVVLVLRDRL
ncbi:MAG: PDZ domain-containing protein [Burkholderiaceae bacterium]